MVKIYCLHLEGDETPIYIGRTKQDLQTRKENHMSDFRLDVKKSNAIRKLRNDGKVICIKLLEICSWEDKADRETFWIRHYLSKGAPLLNSVDNSTSNSEKQKMAASKSLKDKFKDQKFVDKIRAANAKLRKAVIINNVVYASVNEAAAQTKISQGLISSVCNGKRNSKKYNIQWR